MMKLFAMKTFAFALIAGVGIFAAPEAEAQRRGDDWVYCAREGQICRAERGDQVAYGANGYFVYGTANGAFMCDNRTFGRDPIPGVEKHCYVQRDRRDDDRGRRWTFCAEEGEVCRVPAAAVIRFGANGRFNQLRVRGRARVMCDTRTFGDPAPRREKYCEYRLR